MKHTHHKFSPGQTVYRIWQNREARRLEIESAVFQRRSASWHYFGDAVDGETFCRENGTADWHPSREAAARCFLFHSAYLLHLLAFAKKPDEQRIQKAIDWLALAVELDKALCGVEVFDVNC
jgi:hypothetical protein